MAFTTGHALVIGVDTLVNHSNCNVPMAGKDARAVASVLQDPSRCGYIPELVTLLSGEDTTRQALLRHLDRIAGQLTEENTLFLFFVGHGVYGTDDNYHLTTYDVKVNGTKVVAGTGISELELLERLRKVKAKRIFIVINACHSGALQPTNFALEDGETLDSEAPPNKLTDAILSTGEGRIIITASRPDQKSWIGKDELSIFTGAVVGGLRGEAYSNHGYISAYGLYEYVYFETKDRAKTYGKEQDAVLTVLQGVGPFPVALYRGAKVPGTFDLEEPKPKETALREVSPRNSQRNYEHYEALLIGDGALAQGPGAKAVGKGGVLSEGNVTGSSIITGDKNINIIGDGNKVSRVEKDDED